MERSTIDFIVPGEMELTTAVRSVSNNAMSNNKVNNGLLNNTNNSGAGDGGKFDQDSTSKPPHVPPSGSAGIGAPDHHTVFGVRQSIEAWRHSFPPQHPHQNGFIPYTAGGWPPPGTSGPPHFRPLAPPSYRNPPPPPHSSSTVPRPAKAYTNMDGSTTVMQPGHHPLHCPCCGETNWHQQHPQAPFQQYQTMVPQGYIPGYPPHGHVSIAPDVMNGWCEMYQHQFSYHHPGMMPTSNPQTMVAPSQQQPLGHHQLQQQNIQQQQQQQLSLTQQAEQEDIKYGAFSDNEAERVTRRPGKSRPPLQRRTSISGPEPPSSSGGNMWMVTGGQQHPHYVTMSRAANAHGMQMMQQQQQQQDQRRSYHSWDRNRSGPSSGNGVLQKGQPKYSSQPFLNASSILDFPSGTTDFPPLQPTRLPPNIGVGGPANSSSRLPVKGPPPLASKTQLDRLNYRSTATRSSKFEPALPSPPPSDIIKPRYQQPVSEQTTRIANDEYLFPDLPPPPDALLDGPAGMKDGSGGGSNQGTPDLQNSRSSSLDDLHQWVSSAAEMAAAARQHQAVNSGFHTLPAMPSNYNSYNGVGNFGGSGASESDPQYYGHKSGRYSSNSCNPDDMVKLAVNGVRRRPPSASTTPQQESVGGSRGRRGSGAIRIDLSSADKTIRRPGSAPDLGTDCENSLSLSQSTNVSPRKQYQAPVVNKRPGALKTQKSLERSSSIDHRGRKSPGARSGKKVVFTGVSDGESPDESHPDEDTEDDTISKNDVWVLRKQDDKRLKEQQKKKEMDNIPVTGVVIAQPQPCPAQYMVSRVEMTKKQPPLNQKPASSRDGKMTRPLTSGPQPLMRPSAMLPPPGATSSSSSSASSGPRLSSMPAPPMAVGQVQLRPQFPGGPNFGPRPPPPPPPPRTTPQLQRPQNPVLQRPGLQQGPGGQQGVNESPDEGYHEDDGSEVL